MRISSLAAAALLGVAALPIAGCTTGLPAKVTRHSAMPIPQGQTFYVVPGEGVAQGLEFGRYASLVAQQLQARGYRPAGASGAADLLVKLSYAIDEGEVERTVDPFARSRYYGSYYVPRFGGFDPRFGGFDPRFGGYYDPRYRTHYDLFSGIRYGRPYWSRFGYAGPRSAFYYGWDDPFWYYSPYAGYGRSFRQPIRHYTVYKSHLDLDIVRRSDDAPLFEGEAQARSQTDEAGVLVPNLIEAMFTGFPGRSGETVRITVPARKGR